MPRLRKPAVGASSPTDGARNRTGDDADRARLSRWLPLVLITAVVPAYVNSFRGVFLFDDFDEILNEPRVHSLWPLSHVLSGRRPVVDLTLAANYTLGGTSTIGYHAVNLAIHLLAGLTLFGLIRRILMRPRFGDRLRRSAYWLAFTVSLLWLVHPLNTQAVTYIIQRAEALMGLFYLLTLYCVVRGADADRGMRWYVLAIVACVLGMGCKAVMVTAPVVVLLCDWALITGSIRTTLRQRWGLYLGLVATWSVLFVCGVATAVLDPGRTHATVGLGFPGVTSWRYALTEAGVLLHYVKLAVWPATLCLDYDWPYARGLAQVALPLSVVVAMLGATVLLLWRVPRLGVLGACFFVILAPTSSVIPIQDAAFEHRMYLPLVVVILLIVLAVWFGFSALPARQWLSKAWIRRITGVLVAGAFMSLSYRTFARNRDYESPVRMWADVVATRPLNPRAWCNLGKAQDLAGTPEKALRSYRRATQVDPTYGPAYLGLGVVYARRTEWSDAIKAYRRAIQLEPRDADGRCNLGNALFAVGHYDEAVQQYEDGLSIARRNVNCLFNLGSTWLSLGRYEKAVTTLRQATAIEPGHFAARCNLGVALLESGRVAEAIDLFQQILAEHPGHANTHTNLGRAFLREGRRAEAASEFRRALELDPNHLEARRELDALQVRKEP